MKIRGLSVDRWPLNVAQPKDIARLMAVEIGVLIAATFPKLVDGGNAVIAVASRSCGETRHSELSPGSPLIEIPTAAGAAMGIYLAIVADRRQEQLDQPLLSDLLLLSLATTTMPAITAAAARPATM